MQVRHYFNNTTIAAINASERSSYCSVMEDDVQFYWTMMTIDLEEEANQELLQGITGLWVT